jgi:chaperonin GroES
MKLAPMYDQVLIRVEPEKQKTESGIYLGDGGGNEALIGQVLEVGPGVLLESGELCPLPVKVGHWVVLPPHIGSSEMTIDGERLAIMRAREILAIIVDR